MGEGRESCIDTMPMRKENQFYSHEELTTINYSTREEAKQRKDKILMQVRSILV